MDSSRCRPCCSRRPVRALPPVRVLPIYYSWFPHFFLNVNLVKRRRAGDCLAWVSAGLRGLRYFEYYHLSRGLSREGTRVIASDSLLVRFPRSVRTLVGNICPTASSPLQFST